MDRLSKRLGKVGAMVEARAACPAPPPRPMSPDVADALNAGRSLARNQAWRDAIPARFLWATIDEFADPERGRFYMPDVAGDLQAWGSPDCASNLLIVGPTGTCKTHAAVAACRMKFDRGFDVVFQPVVELLNALRPGGPEGLLEELSWVDLLILDDLGAEKSSEWTAEQLYAIVNRRWMQNLPTVVTSNLTLPLLRECATARVFSRLLGCDAHVIQMTGDDRRLPARP